MDLEVAESLVPYPFSFIFECLPILANSISGPLFSSNRSRDVLNFLLYAKYMVIFRYPMTPTKKKRRPDANAQRYKSKLPYVSPTMTCLIKKEQGSRGHPRHYQHRYIPPFLYSLCGVVVDCVLWHVISKVVSSTPSHVISCDERYSFLFFQLLGFQLPRSYIF